MKRIACYFEDEVCYFEDEVWYFEESGVVLLRGLRATLKSGCATFMRCVVLLRGRCATLERVV